MDLLRFVFQAPNFRLKLSVCRCHCVHSSNSSTKRNQPERINEGKKREETAHVHENACRPESMRWSCYIYIKLYKFDVFHLEIIFKIRLHSGVKHGMCDKKRMFNIAHSIGDFGWIFYSLSLSSLPRFDFEREKLSTQTT